MLADAASGTVFFFAPLIVVNSFVDVIAIAVWRAFGVSWRHSFLWTGLELLAYFLLGCVVGHVVNAFSPRVRNRATRFASAMLRSREKR